jgi:transposase
MELSPKQRQREVILYLWNNNIRSAKEIHQRTSIGLSTIYYNLKKLKEKGNVAQEKGQGRPKIITDSLASSIGAYIRRNPIISVGDLVNKLREKGINIGREAVRTHLIINGYKNSLPLATPMLTAKHKEKRIEWAKKHLDDNWSQTLFSDETSFQLFRNTITQWYKRARPVRPISKNQKKIHAWGEFCLNGKTSLFCFVNIMNAEFYVEILKEQLPEVKEMMEDGWRFQQDNDPKHTSRLAKNFLQENVPVVIDWPANSPDLNPIENLWGIVKRNVEKRRPKNLEDLETFMVEEWARIPDGVLKLLIDSMPGRCDAVIKGEGERINY